MARILRNICCTSGLGLFFLFTLPTADLFALSVDETKTFREGPFLFKMEIQVHGSGSLKKTKPFRITSLKVKIKNERDSSEALKVKSIRAYIEPKIYGDIETRGFSVSPAQWVTKYYRLRKGKQPSFGDKGYIEIAFENFVIRFDPRERKFQGPLP